MSVVLDNKATVDKRIDEWKKRLIDLSKRNKFLSWNSNKSNLIILEPSLEEVFNRLILQEKSFTFWIPEPEEDMEDNQLSLLNQDEETQVSDEPDIEEGELLTDKSNSKNFESLLKRILRQEKTDYEEKGFRTIYVSFGVLNWQRFNQGKKQYEELKSPLVSCPVVIKRESPNDPFELSIAEDDIFLNPVLQVVLKQDFGIELPEEPSNWDEIGINGYLEQIKQVLSEQNWSVEPVTIVSRLSFHKFAMYQDLETNADFVSKHNLVNALCLGKFIKTSEHEIPDEKGLDKITIPEETYQIVDADSSQQKCIQAALRGHSFVLQGPPGTGKSQTISNIISEFLARGKKVLFVSEKMAALEVVFNRLEDSGISSLCLELHSAKANRKEVVTELNESLENRLKPENLMTQTEFENLKALKNKLNNYVNALHSLRKPFQESVYKILGKVSKLNGIQCAPIKIHDVNQLELSQVQELKDLTRQLSTVWKVKIEGDNFPWKDCKADSFSTQLKAEYMQLMNDLIAALSDLNDCSSKLAYELGYQNEMNINEVYKLIELSEHLKKNPYPHKNWVLTNEIDVLFDSAKEYKKLNSEYWKIKNDLDIKYNESFYEIKPIVLSNLEYNIEEINLLISNEKYQNILKCNLEEIQSVRSFVEETSKLITEISNHGSEIANFLGFNQNSICIETLQAYCKFILLANTCNKPDKNWFDPTNLQKLKSFIAEIKEDYESYHQLKEELLEKYDVDFLDIPNIRLRELIENFNSFTYKNHLKWLNPQYHKDIKYLKSLTKCGNKPENISEDLYKARDFARFSDKLLKLITSNQNILGSYYKEIETSLENIEEAIGLVEAVTAFTSYPIDENLIKITSSETVIPTRFINISQEIISNLENWHNQKEKYDKFIPFNFIPVHSLDFNKINIFLLNEWLINYSYKLETLIKNLQETSKYLKGSYIPNIEQTKTNLQNNQDLSAIKLKIEQESNRLLNKFGNRFEKEFTNWDEVLASLEWTKTLRGIVLKQEISEKLLEVICNNNLSISTNQPLIEKFDKFNSNYDKFIKLFSSKIQYKDNFLENLNFWDLKEYLEVHINRIDDLKLWVNYKELKECYKKIGQSDFIEYLERNLPESKKLEAIAEKSILSSWVEAIFVCDVNLKDFKGQSHQKLINEFKEIDRKVISNAYKEVIRKTNLDKPTATSMQFKGTEVNVLRNEAAKKRKHLSVRKLFEKIPNLLLSLKPCLMMSPLSVSQYLHPDKFEFDVVIFDEASQIFTEDAIGSVYRGKQLIVAGDSKQLPPSDFFRTSDDGDEYLEEDDEDVSSADYNSVLDELGLIIPQEYLRWHYRSRHEDLIVFSNNRYYNSKLVTFPCSMKDDSSLGIKFEYVEDGVYDRGGKRINEVEAKRVVKLIFEHFDEYPGKSLGVITFSKAQQTAIEDLVELYRKEHPEYQEFFIENRLEGFFIKNLENVQGDERDVIIFSIGYGKDKAGKMSLSFGPLNKAGGERRLNVAVTRAREKVVLVSSIQHSDIDVKNTSNEGVLNLYKYLEFAEVGVSALDIDSCFESGEFDSPFEEEVASVVKSFGYDIVSQVGCSGYRIDMGVVDPASPGKYILGIECDGATYHSALTARDRDRLRQQVLENLGWTIYRIWSIDWFYNRNEEINKLKAALSKAKENSNNFFSKQSTLKVQKKNELKQVNISNNLPEDYILPGTKTYKVAIITCKYHMESRDFYYLQHNGELERLITEVVNVESPIHIDLLIKRITEACGFARAGSNIRGTIISELNSRNLRTKVFIKNDFIWLTDRSISDIGIRVPNKYYENTIRKIEHICPEEIQLAATILVKNAFSIELDSLIIELARLFGFNRTTENIKDEISKNIEYLLKKKVLKKENLLVSMSCPRIISPENKLVFI